jgi:hypothetical protein
MTFTQNKAIWELCRQGLHGAAAGAERSWGDGERFESESPLPLTRELALLIDRANWDACASAAPRRTAPMFDLSAQRLSAAA